MAFHRAVIGEIEYELVTLDTFRMLFESVGGGVMKMTVVKREDGYVLHGHMGYQARKSFGLKAEKSGQQRVFKSMDSALRVCRKLGLSVVQVEL